MIAAALTVVAATEAEIGKTLAAAAAEDVLDAAVVAGGGGVAAVAAVSVGGGPVFSLRQNTLPRRAIAAGMGGVIGGAGGFIRKGVVTISVAPAVTSTIAAMLRALLHHLLQATRQKN